MNKRQRKKTIAKQAAEISEALAVLGGQPRPRRRHPCLTWRERRSLETKVEDRR